MQAIFPEAITFNNQCLDLRTPVVMGIINCTPDSFYQPYKKNTLENQYALAMQMLEQGASILDIGGASSKPNAPIIDQKEERKRIESLLKFIIKQKPKTWISIDTYHSETAKMAVNEGASMINDISAGNIDPQMLSTIAKLNVPYILMHMQGTPQTMQINPTYSNIVQEVTQFLNEKIVACKNAGIQQIILDVGIGFGKTIAHNFQLLNSLSTFLSFNKPLLIGVSRKSLIYKSLGITPQEALNGSTILHTTALLQGTSILRVHDVAQAVECVKLVELLKQN